jgi:hypothetical protein
LVSHNKGRIYFESVKEIGAEGIFGPKRKEVTGGWRKYIIRNFIIRTLRRVLLG